MNQGDARGVDTDQVDVLGVKIARLTMQGAVDQVASWLEDDRLPQRGRVIFTLNPEMIYAAQSSPQLERALAERDLGVPDGIGVVWASRLLGDPLPARVAGIELMHALLDLAAIKKWPVFFLGAEAEVIQKAVQRLKARFPGLLVAGFHHGYFDLQDPQVVQLVAASKPRLLFCGMGVPRDQFWLAAHRQELGPVVSMGVGGSFDVVAGVSKRAPGWMRALNLEWFYRLMQEPSRWRRQLVLPAFAWQVVLAALGRED